MHELTYKIENTSPLVISSKFGDMNMVSTQKYIPGTTVLGILAQRVSKAKKLSGNNHEDDDFYKWFLAGDLCIGNAYIAPKKQGEKSQAFFPTPLSIKTEKYNKDKVYDFLYHNNPNLELKSTKPFCKLSKNKIDITDVDVNLNFHHARDYKKGIPKPEIIFNYESISPGQSFVGVIRGSKADLSRLVEICGSFWVGHAGRSKNSQYGIVKIMFEDNSLKQLINKKIQDDVISLTLLSDTILHNSNGFPSTNVSDLKEYIEGVTILKSFIKKASIEGFVGVWRLKTPAEQCLQAGSTFLLDISRCDQKKLMELQNKGLGERVHEGFGRCEFNLQTVNKLIPPEKDKENSKKIPVKPDENVPENVKIIVKTIVREYIKKEIELKALNDQSKFVRLPSNSLISKLGAMAQKLSADKFITAVQQLRNTAKNKLERCYNQQEKLSEFLIKPHIDNLDILKNKESRINRLCNDINYDPTKDITFYNQLNRIYLQVFFLALRKKKETEGGII